MTDEEMLSTVKALVADERLDAFCAPYLALAKSAVMARLFPYEDGAEWGDVPAKHHGRTCEIAVYLVNKRGAEGETSHSENGVTRAYGAADIPSGYFDGMVPRAGVPA